MTRAAIACAALALSLAAPAGAGVYGDFNGDGIADLAVGSPLEDVASVDDSGAVNVLYGRPGGLSATGDQHWHEGNIDIPDGPDVGDRFGAALAVGDFDGDGYADLAIGAPGETVVAADDAGAVYVLHGSFLGLTDDRTSIWHQNVDGMSADGAEAGDQFGSALAAADFGRGRTMDLAVGVPGENVGAVIDAGAVDVVYGSRRGLVVDGDHFLFQDLPGVEETAESSDRFGAALAAANLGKSSHADLAVGIPGESVGATSAGGSVAVLYGSPDGVRLEGDQLWHQDKGGIGGDGAEPSDSFGQTLAAADLGRSSHADLAIGVPLEDLDVLGDAGVVHVLYGSRRGTTLNGDQLWHQGRAGMAGDGAEIDDQFGSALAIGDFGKGAKGDLAVGASAEDIGAVDRAGAVSVIYGSAAGLTTAGDQFWHQDSVGLAGDGIQDFDRFGSALAAANFGRGSRADLAIGAPFDDVPTVNQAGTVTLLFGSSNGLSAAGDEFWHRDSDNVAGGGADIGGQFGTALAPRR